MLQLNIVITKWVASFSDRLDWTDGLDWTGLDSVLAVKEKMPLRENALSN